MSGPWYSQENDTQDVLEKLDIKELLILVVLRLDTIINHLYSITDEEGV